MLTYDVDGTILKLTLKGTPSEGQRALVHAEIANDPRVPPGALVLIDITRADPIDDVAEMQRRTRLLTDRLGSKLGPAVAVVVPPRLTEISEKFLALRTDPAGLRVALFRDEPAARQWLATFEVR
jgi:hypothetical protein